MLLCCWSRISLALALFPCWTPSEVFRALFPPRGLHAEQILVSQKPPPPAPGPAQPPTSSRSLPSSCCFGLVKQLLSDPAFPPLCHPRSRAAPSPRCRLPQHVRPGAHAHVTDRCVSRCLCGRGQGAFQAQGGATALVWRSHLPVCCSKPVGEHLGFTPLPWNSALPRLQDAFFCLLCVRVCGVWTAAALTAALMLLFLSSAERKRCKEAEKLQNPRGRGEKLFDRDASSLRRCRGDAAGLLPGRGAKLTRQERDRRERATDVCVLRGRAESDQARSRLAELKANASGS